MKNAKSGKVVKSVKAVKVVAYKQAGKMYAKAMAFIRSKQVVTRSMVEKFYADSGKKVSAAIASATVLLSPRKEDSLRGKFGNCLGNFSADGVHYFMVPLNHKKGEEKKFRFHLCTAEEVVARQAIEDKRGNGRKSKEVAQVKTVKTSKKVKTVKKVAKKAKAKKVKVAKVVEPVAVTVPAEAVVAPVAPVAPVAETPVIG